MVNFFLENWPIFLVAVVVLIAFVKRKTIRKLFLGYTFEEIRRDEETVKKLKQQFEQHKKKA